MPSDSSDESTVEGDVVEEEEEEEDFPTLDDIRSVPSSPVSEDFEGMCFDLSKGADLRNIVDVLADMLEEANMTFTDKGLNMFALDGAHVACVVLKLKAEKFDHYNCSRRPITIGVNMTSLKKIMSCVAAKDTVEWSLDGPDPDKITISTRQTGVSQIFEMKLVNIEEDPMAVPNTRYEKTVRLSADAFQKKMKDFAKLGGDAVEFTIAPGSFVMKMKEAEMVENSRATYTLVEDEPEKVVIHCSETSSNIFISSYIARFAKAACLSKWVSIRMLSDAPIKFVFAAGDLGQLTFYLAPKIED